MTLSTKIPRVALAIGALALVAVAATPGLASAAARTQLVSVSSTGPKGNGESSEPSNSRNGRFIAFHSTATNLVKGDTNGVSDCFVHDRVARKTWRVSIPTGGGQANGACYGPAINATGRFVAFESNATNLGGATNGQWQVYLHDRVAKRTVLVSERWTGGDGGAGRSVDAAISDNGRFVAFVSSAVDLVPGDNNGQPDVFVWNRANGNTRLVSVRSNGAQGNRSSQDPDISSNGRFIVFDSDASNLVANDKNGKRDVFIHDRRNGKTGIVSVNSRERRGNGDSGNPSVSADGRWVAFESQARNITRADRSSDLDVFLRDRKKGRTYQVSVNSRGRQVYGHSGDPSISNNGRYIAFMSTAPNLVRNDRNKTEDVFLRDRVKRTTKLVSRRADGKLVRGGDSDDPSISADGRFVVFESEAKGVVPRDRDALEDVYSRGPLR